MHVNLDGGTLRNKEIPDGHHQKTIPLSLENRGT